MKNFTEQEVRQLVRDLEIELTNRGIDADMRIVDSTTDFGCSSYLYVGNRFKVRASDHSCGTKRILEEICLFSVNSVADELEYYYFPDRFETKKVLVFGCVHDRGLDTLVFENGKVFTKNNIEVNVIDDSNWFTQKGREMVKIQLKNKEEVIIKRK